MGVSRIDDERVAREAGAASEEPDKRPFNERVYAVVCAIPRGNVTTYGSIARALGRPRWARQVGWALHAVPEDLDAPCHRVVNHRGELTGAWHFGPPEVMRGLLLAEAVPLLPDGRVDLQRCYWDPATESADSPAANEMNDFDDIPV